MNKEQILSLVRTILSAVGAFFIGKYILGNKVDEPLLELIVGAVMTLASIIWSIVDKTATLEKMESGVRQIIIVIGGLLVSAGKLSAEKLETYVGLAVALTAFIWSTLGKKKTEAISSGKVDVSNLKK